MSFLELAPEKFCPHCHSIERPKSVCRGHFITELLLWILTFVAIASVVAWALVPFLFVIALIYSCYRVFSRHPACRKCRMPGVVPLDTPVVRAYLKDHPDEVADLRSRFGISA